MTFDPNWFKFLVLFYMKILKKIELVTTQSIVTSQVNKRLVYGTSSLSTKEDQNFREKASGESSSKESVTYPHKSGQKCGE